MRRVLLILLATGSMAVPAWSQLCNGSLGDPVVHITFGAGSNPGTALSTATSYSFTNTDCPPDGSYTVRNATANCFGSSWHNISADHTGNANGYFMLVNASFQPGDFYVQTVNGLCANTTYEFAAWVLNVLRPSACGGSGIDPNLTFRIETTTGTVLATYESGDIAESSSPTWKQYGLFFTTPPAVSSVVVRITNKAPGGCGNDILLDDITFRPCGPQVLASLALTGDTAVLVCDGDQTSFLLNSNSSTGYSDPVFQWQISVDGSAWTDIPGATTLTYNRQPTGSGVYLYRLSAAERTNAGQNSCRVASNNIRITVHPLPEPDVNDVTDGCETSTVVLQAADGNNYAWTGPNGFTSNEQQPELPNIQPSDAGMYYVTVTNDACTQQDSTRLLVHPAVTAAVTNNSVTICEGSAATLQASGGTQYAWSPAAGLSSALVPNPAASPADSVIYTVTVTSDHGCFDTASIAVNVWKKPVANAGPDKQMIEGDTVLLEGAAAGTNVSYNWTPPVYINNPLALQPTANPTENITYMLTVSSNFGCGQHSDKMFVRVYKEVKIPNAFSPNGDGVNDTWILENLDTYPEADLQVFNRHGQLMYRGRGSSRPWNGTYNGSPLPVGTYYYVIDLKTNFFPRLSGWIFLVR